MPYEFSCRWKVNDKAVNLCLSNGRFGGKRTLDLKLKTCYNWSSQADKFSKIFQALKMRIYLKRLLRLVGSILGAYLAAAFIFSALTVSAKPHDCAKLQPIYIQHSAIHANLAVPTSSLSKQFHEDIKLPVRSDFIVVGVGDRDVYLNSPNLGDIKLGQALKAVFWPTKRVLHAAPYDDVGTDWIRVNLCPEQLAAIEAYMVSSISRREDGLSQIVEGATYWGADRFYEADGHYSAFNSCNNWVNGAMKAAGLKAPVWSPFSQGIIYHARRQN